jgi:E3 ubiquitin-protein ligase SIAH1
MEDLSLAFDEVLLSDLECPVCMEYMVPPIKFCMNGHNICSKCREKVQHCPTCRAEFADIRNVALENIIRRQKYPCANRKGGCRELFSIEHIAKHQALCVYGKIKCPYDLFHICFWIGFKNDLKEHVKTAHPEYLVEGSTFTFPSLFDSGAIVFCFGELFTYYQMTKDGRNYAALQLIGTSSDASKYKYKCTLRATNGIEEINKTFLVRGYSEDWETIFNSGICVCLDEKTVKHFLEESKQKLTVTLSKV